MYLHLGVLLTQLLLAFSHPNIAPCPTGVNQLYYTQCPYRMNTPYPNIVIKLDQDKTSPKAEDVPRAGNTIESVLTSTKKKVSNGLLKSLLSLPEAVADTVLGDTSE
ncbi:unnamed protein product [Colias eurytheme]|nr:unnamed protein product [Colias eurytheme]